MLRFHPQVVGMAGDLNRAHDFLQPLTDDLEDYVSYVSDLMAAVPHPVYVVNPADVITDSNKALERLTGWSLEELLGKNHHSLFARGVALDELYDEMVRERHIQGKELILLTRHGGRIPVCIYARAKKDDSGKVSYVAALIDISQRKQAEEEAKQNAEKLVKAMESVVQAMAMTVELRDPYTAGHQRRVSQLACALAREIGLPEHDISGLRLAGLIHDIGKIRVPTEILTNPDGLTEAEFNLIKMHPVVGYDVLRALEFPWPIAQIVHQHHERMDGSGYPLGLSGKDIILEARILAVADVVEAIASHRPYRPAYGIDKAIEEILQNKGVLYDPQVVDACSKLLTEKRFEFE